MAGVAVVVLACGLSVCGGNSDKATPKPTVTAETTPAVPVQPKGTNGVAYDIQNWGDYANDPIVLAWKQTNEALNASVNLTCFWDPTTSLNDKFNKIVGTLDEEL